MIPPEELLRLAEAASKAHQFGSEERYLTGYLLLYGLLLTIRGNPEPWAIAAAKLWAEALEKYKTRYPRNWGDVD